MDVIELSNNPNLTESCLIHNSKELKIKPYGLNELNDINIQQALILKDLLFVLLGNEGYYIRFSEKFNVNDNNLTIKGPDFKIAKHLDISIKSLTKKIIKFGKFYTSINKFIEIYNNQYFGKIIQQFIECLINFKTDYERLIIDIENQFKFNSSFNLINLENLLNEKVLNSMNHYYEIINSIHQETLIRQSKRRKGNNQPDGINIGPEAIGNDEYFNNFINYLTNDLKQSGTIDLSTDLMNFPVCKGGVVLKILQDRIDAFKGDSKSTEFLIKLFNEINKSYLNSLNQWLINGIIDDPFEEFLVKENKFPNNLINYQMEKYWDEKYLLRNDGLINQFKDKEIKTKILLTGKYLNIFKIVNNLENLESLNESFNKIDNLFTTNFEIKVNFFYKRANKLLIKLMFEGFKFKNLINFYSEKFLLNNSYKVDKFLDNNFNDLLKDKYKISISKLIKSFSNTLIQDEDNKDIWNVFSKNLEISIDSTNFFELSKEILSIRSFDAEEALNSKNSDIFKQLLNKSLTKASSEQNLSNDQSNIENFDNLTILGINLELNLSFPLNIIINQSYNFEYQLIFKIQILIRFLNKLIDNVWKEINLTNVWKFKNFNNKINKWIIRCKILHNRLKDFINEFHYYINFDIIENNIKNLNSYLKKIETNSLKQPLETVQEDFEINNNSKTDYKFYRNVSINYNDLFNDNLKRKANSNNNSNDNINDNTNDNEIEEELDINQLINKIGSFLNNILRDSFITNGKTLNILKTLFYVIIDYNQFLLRLKKSIIMMNEELFNQFNEIYPEKFNDKTIDHTSINMRFNNLNNLLNYHYENFNNSLTEFMVLVKNLGDLENQSFLILIEKLEQCFPDH